MCAHRCVCTRALQLWIYRSKPHWCYDTKETRQVWCDASFLLSFPLSPSEVSRTCLPNADYTRLLLFYQDVIHTWTGQHSWKKSKHNQVDWGFTWVLGLCSNLHFSIQPPRRAPIGSAKPCWLYWTLELPCLSTASETSPLGVNALSWPLAPSLLVTTWSLFPRTSAPSFHLPKLGSWESASAPASFIMCTLHPAPAVSPPAHASMLSSLATAVSSHLISP